MEFDMYSTKFDMCFICFFIYGMLTNFHAKTCIPLICGMWLLPFNWDSVNMPSYMA